MSLRVFPFREPSEAIESTKPKSAIMYSTVPHGISTISGRNFSGVNFILSLILQIYKKLASADILEIAMGAGIPVLCAAPRDIKVGDI